jgi:hypothetical protein
MDKLIYLDGYNRIIKDIPFYGELVMDTSDLGEESVDIDFVLTEVVSLYNSGADLQTIDKYLMDEPKCSQEDREVITETFFNLF